MVVFSTKNSGRCERGWVSEEENVGRQGKFSGACTCRQTSEIFQAQSRITAMRQILQPSESQECFVFPVNTKVMFLS